MKPVFKCDYCSKMGTKEEIKEHEPNCMCNYDRRSCYTCLHKKGLSMENNLIKYNCDKDKNIPAGNVYEFCDLYERKEIKIPKTYSDIFDSVWGHR